MVALGQRAQAIDHARDPIEKGIHRILGTRLRAGALESALQVGAGTEGPAGAGEHDDAYPWIAFDQFEGARQLVAHRPGQGVHRRGAVQREAGRSPDPFEPQFGEVVQACLRVCGRFWSPQVPVSTLALSGRNCTEGLVALSSVR